MKNILIPLIILCMVFVLVFTGKNEDKSETCTIPTPGGEWQLEIADTIPKRRLGLMYRGSLCEQCGILFTFPDVQKRSFWMKDTYIPLDMYFYDQFGLQVDTSLNMLPDDQTGHPMIYISNPAQYVIEVNAGVKLPAGFSFMRCINY